MRTLFSSITVVLFLAALPVAAEQGKLKVQRSTDASGNPVIVIHESRPEVLAKQRTQVYHAQARRHSQKERELRLEIERLRAERELVEAQARREAAQRSYAAAQSRTYRYASQPKARASFFNGGLGPLGGVSFGPWGGYGYGGFYGYGSYGGFYPGSGWGRGCR